MNQKKQKKYNLVLEIIKKHRCEDCTSCYKRHLLDQWFSIINESMPGNIRIDSTKSLSKIFKILKSKGVYHEIFLLGKGRAQLRDNFYVYKKR